jgi:hypothetical protein
MIGYKQYNLITKKVIMSRDIIFEEDKTWQCNKNKKEVKCISIDLIIEDELEVPRILIKGPIVLAEEPQTPSHRFRVFNKRNKPSSGSSLLPSSTSLSEEPRRMRNIEDLYDVT